MEDKQITVELIQPHSNKYRRACQLRYELFFAEHDLPWDVVFNQRQANDFHASISIEDRLVAYGQLVPQCDRIYQIRQMVVDPSYQRQNLGKRILSFLIEIAKQEAAIALTLNARLTAVGFYQKLGFKTFGTPFPSTTTGVPHIAMNRKL